ncbi:hypothetical protein GCM10011497_15030 [Elstera cyanobacteriorum]|uniref:Uncharacterized protein n=1 Tax=Elstera cyanobacteriorum TaxID=2022747 RepID=A0A255XL81_9PROT|nr:hypothetical protein [Elstera cyanobacteriorum]OYQ17716.1 hypothetical protein CHR90_12070 [Elstera cyanobacteriorum]GFZ86740.1 hypothetical protein GCM10011497_15030 [Elstera cyanobacteriorum]
MREIDREISDYAAGIFLRHFRSGGLLGAESPSLDLVRDIDLLRAHWAISAPVREFLQYLLAHRHDAQALLQFQRRTDDAVARGRIDARASVIARRVAGHPSLTVSEEPVRSFNTGPNQVVAWVVQMAATYAEQLFAMPPKISAYTGLIETAMKEISAVKRLDALREPLKHVIMGRRPGPNVLRDAARSRRLIYRYAIAAYMALTGIEAGNEAALASVLHSTLLGPLEVWRRFELAVASGIGEALSLELALPLRLSVLDASPGQPVLRCGRLSLFWQSGGGLYMPPAPEPSEMRLAAVLAAYGMASAADRPDLVLVDNQAERVVAIIEVKYLTGDTASARFQEAAGQIIRYGRGYTGETDLPALIRRSLIVLSQAAPTLLNDTAVAPRAVDFNGIKSGLLRDWVRDWLSSVA